MILNLFAKAVKDFIFIYSHVPSLRIKFINLPRIIVPGYSYFSQINTFIGFAWIYVYLIKLKLLERRIDCEIPPFHLPKSNKKNERIQSERSYVGYPRKRRPESEPILKRFALNRALSACHTVFIFITLLLSDPTYTTLYRYTI